MPAQLTVLRAAPRATSRSVPPRPCPARRARWPTRSPRSRSPAARFSTDRRPPASTPCALRRRRYQLLRQGGDAARPVAAAPPGALADAPSLPPRVIPLPEPKELLPMHPSDPSGDSRSVLPSRAPRCGRRDRRIARDGHSPPRRAYSTPPRSRSSFRTLRHRVATCRSGNPTNSIAIGETNGPGWKICTNQVDSFRCRRRSSTPTRATSPPPPRARRWRRPSWRALSESFGPGGSGSRNRRDLRDRDRRKHPATAT